MYMYTYMYMYVYMYMSCNVMYTYIMIHYMLLYIVMKSELRVKPERHNTCCLLTWLRHMSACSAGHGQFS